MSQCRFHAGVANNRFIGCLVGSFSLETQALLYEPTPNPFESPFGDVKTKRTGKNLPVRFVWRKRGDSLRDIQIITCFNFILFLRSFFVTMSLSRRGCKQPFHRLFGRLVLIGNSGIVVRADSQPVRIPFRRRQNKTNRQKFACSFCLAEARGFEPLSP